WLGRQPASGTGQAKATNQWLSCTAPASPRPSESGHEETSDYPCAQCRDSESVPAVLPVKICEFCFDICPRWLRFRLTFGHTRVHDSTHPSQAPEIWLVMSHTSHRHPWENNSHR